MLMIQQEQILQIQQLYGMILLNSNYREQFIAILNAANQTGQLFGKPRESGTIGGIKTEVYTLSQINQTLPIFTFYKKYRWNNKKFEIVPSTIDNSDQFMKQVPIPGNRINLYI